MKEVVKAKMTQIKDLQSQIDIVNIQGYDWVQEKQKMKEQIAEKSS